MAKRKSQSDRSTRSAGSSRPNSSGRSNRSNRSDQQGVVPAYSSDSQRYQRSRNSQPHSDSNRRAATDQYSRNNPSYSKRAKKSGAGKKVAVGVLAAFVLVLVGVGTAFGLFVNGIDRDLIGDLSDDEMKDIQDALVPLVSFDEPFYIMLIGSDEREGSDEEGKRSDTAILARVDAPNGVVTLISIPRDTMITPTGYGTQKFNAVFSYDGAAGTIREASKLCGVSISHYAEVNFTALIELVDVVGGVEVEVAELIDDPDAGPIVIQPGLQTLDGEASLVFVRSRAYADGDFTRTSNQRLLLEALMNKVLTMSAAQLPGVVQGVAASVTTDLNATSLLSLATQLQGAQELTMYSAMVPSTTDMIDGVSYVITETAELSAMMKIVEAGGDPNDTASVSTDSSSDSSGPYTSNTPRSTL